MRRSAAVTLQQLGHRKFCTTAGSVGGSPNPTWDRLDLYRNQRKLTGELTKTKGDGGRGTGHRPCTGPACTGVSLATALAQSAKPAGDIRGGRTGPPTSGKHYRKTRTRGRSYLHNIQTNASTRGPKKYKQQEEEVVCLEQS